MGPLLLKASCFSSYVIDNYENNTSAVPLLGNILKGCTHLNISIISTGIHTNGTYRKPDMDDDIGALLYIICVLVIYSVAIDVMMIKFLSKGKRELDEENKLKDFFRGMEISRREMHQDNVNRVAIQAFHTITTNVSNEDITTDSGDTEMVHLLPTCSSVPTIKEEFVENRLRYSLPCGGTRCKELSV
jgi:hypothetical protein